MRTRDVINYALAAVLLVASIPLYRYIIDRGQSADQPALPNLPAEVTRTANRVFAVRDSSVRLECIRGTIYRRDTDGATAVGKCPKTLPAPGSGDLPATE